MGKTTEIYFIREQDGETEKAFKDALYPILNCYNEPIRAYLVQTRYGDKDNTFNVALCLVISEKAEQDLLSKIIKVFKSMFGKNEHLDIIFLNEKQEHDIRQVSYPFFINSSY